MVSKKYGGITVNFHCEKEKLKATNLIYLLKFTNGKYYVGQTNTKFGLISRIQNHCYESYHQNKKRAARKIGKKKIKYLFFNNILYIFAKIIKND